MGTDMQDNHLVRDDSAKNYRIAITGATGFVAKNLRRHLSGLDIRGISRRKFRARLHETIIKTDYSSAAELASKIRGCDIMVHLAGIGDGGDCSSYMKANVDVTSVVVRAAKSAKIRQIIFLSGLGVSRANPSDYFASKFKAEQVIRASGMAYTIFRPSFIIGAGDYLTNLLDRQARAGRLLIPGNGKCILQPVFIHDVTSIICSSFLNSRFQNKTFDLVGPQTVTLRDFARLYHKSVNITKVPLEDCLHDAFSGRDAAYTIGDLNLFYGGYVGDPEKLQKVYGRPLTPVRDFL